MGWAGLNWAGCAGRLLTFPGQSHAREAARRFHGNKPETSPQARHAPGSHEEPDAASCRGWPPTRRSDRLARRSTDQSMIAVAEEMILAAGEPPHSPREPISLETAKTIRTCNIPKICRLCSTVKNTQNHCQLKNPQFLLNPYILSIPTKRGGNQPNEQGNPTLTGLSDVLAGTLADQGERSKS